MNSKKGKKKSKPHPTPAVVIDNKEIHEEVKEPVVSEKEQIITEAVCETVLEELKLEDAVPNKPKRNRGKKKKQEKEEGLGDVNKQMEKEICYTPIIEETIVSDMDNKASEKDKIDEKCLENETVTPTIRKKKNKKKENNQIVLPEEQVELTSKKEMIAVEENKTELNKSTENETAKKSNKKNKKKKRHDSEKSDKVDEISSEAVSQPLITDVDEELTITSAENKLESENVVTKKQSDIAFGLQLEETNQDIIELHKNTTEIDISKEEPHLCEKSSKHTPKECDTPKEENKYKQKGKKDKKHVTVANTDDVKVHEFLCTLPQEKTICHEFTQDTVTITDNESVTINIATVGGSASEPGEKSVDIDNDLKPKAVIAKPVEKKRKGKQDFDEVRKTQEDVVQVIEIKCIDNKTPPQETVVEKDSVLNKDEMEPKVQDILEDVKPDFIHRIDKDVVLTKEFEVIQIPDNAMGKKRKKSPKTPRVAITISNDLKATSVEFDTGDRILPDSTVILTENINAPETKSRKKGKKAKMPLTPGVTDFIPSFDTESITTLEQVSTLEQEKSIQMTTMAPGNLNVTGDVEIKPPVVGQKEKVQEKCNMPDIPFIDTEDSVKLDTETSFMSENIRHELVKNEKFPIDTNETLLFADSPKSEVTTPILDIIPDIHYPRSTSQDLDGNNNTVIREARPDELQLPGLKDSPVVQGSGETPVGTPKMIMSDIVISEVSETEKPKEKTDLKSKMIEVNRDMEELRMSIERSLAEFTAIEKSEQNIENEYETKMKIDDQGSRRDIIQGDQYNIKECEQSNMTPDLKTEGTTEKIQVACEDNQNKCGIKDIETSKAVTLSESTHIEEPINIPSENTEVVKDKLAVSEETEQLETFKTDSVKEQKCTTSEQPVHPHRRDNKGKNKKKKGKQEAAQSVPPFQTTHTTTESKNTVKEDKTEEKHEKSTQDSGNTQEKSQQKNQANTEPSDTNEFPDDKQECIDSNKAVDFEPIENFEDALSSSTEEVDINKSFDMIVNEANAEIELNQQRLAANKPEIKIIGPDEKPKEKVKPSKNLLGHPNIPAPSSKTDYKKEKNKTPNTKQAMVKIKDSVDIELPEDMKSIDKESAETSETNNASDKQTNSIYELLGNQLETEDSIMSVNLKNDLKVNGDRKEFVKDDMNKQSYGDELGNSNTVNSRQQMTLIKEVNHSVSNTEKRKQSTQSQTENKKNRKHPKNKDSFTQLNENEEFVYKYSFRKVFLQNACHVCKKELKVRVHCNFCNLLFYCSNKHKDEDWPQHQALCFAISTIGHMKSLKYIYADTKNIVGHNYRLVRMQMILSCEKVLKRRLVPWEQELLLYPRMCADGSCRQWKQSKLKDCDGCGQISYCADKPEHLPKAHQRWCKSYSLYQKLVIHQQTKGRLEPKMPTKVMAHPYQIPDKLNEVLASMFEEKIDMNDVEYVALTQMATAPLTAAYGYQVYASKINTTNGLSKKPTFTIHVVGAELQFEADALNKWEVFFLHLRPDVQELKVVLIGTDLNPSNLPLDLLGKIKHCENCRTSKRRVSFSFQDKKRYSDYRSSADYCYPDLICAFNPSIQRSSIYKDLDIWPSTLNAVLRTKAPLILTAYSITELLRDSLRMKECADVDFKVISEAKYNSFASVRPDRNFITDDEMPLLFKNYCYMIVCG